jgi:hypothetical protein
MRILLKKLKRRKTENGYYFNEQPEVFVVNKTFKKGDKHHITTIKFGKYYSECQAKNDPCLCGDTLTAKSGGVEYSCLRTKK